MTGFPTLRMLRSRRLALLAAVAIAAALLPAAGAPAQDEEPPPAEPLTLTVNDVHVPPTREKAIRRGLFVNATCSIDCLIVVKVSVSPSVASKMGLNWEVIATGAAPAAADTPRWVRARLRPGARRALEDFQGDAQLHIRIRALP